MVSNKNIIQISIILTLLVILISGFATAFTEDFRITTEQESIGVCSCAVRQNTIYIQNSGEIGSNYFVQPAGEIADTIEYSDYSFYLNPGETKEIYQFVKAPCGKQGKYLLETIISTQLGVEKTIKQKINIENCANIGLTIINPVETKCPTKAAEFRLQVSNTGGFLEKYTLYSPNYPEYVSFTQRDIVIEPGQVVDIKAYVKFPQDAYGDKKVILAAKASKTEYEASTDALFSIPQSCFQFTSMIPAEDEFCKIHPNQIEIVLENNAEIINNYELKVKWPIWARQTAEITVLPNTKRTAVIEVTPPLWVRANEKKFKIQVKSDKGEIYKEEIIYAELFNCYKLDVGYQGEDGKEIYVSTNEQTTVNAYIKNIGTQTDSVSFWVEGPDFATVSKTTADLDSEEEELIPITFNVPEEPDKNRYKVKLFAESTTHEKSKSKDSFRLILVSETEAYKPSVKIKRRDRRVEYGEDSIPVTIKNEGIKQATYKLELSTVGWAELSQKTVTLDEGEEQTIYVETNTNEDNENMKYKSSLIITPSGKDFSYTKDFKIDLQSTRWYVAVGLFAWNFAKTNWLWILIGIAALVFLVLLFKLFKWIKRKRPEWKEAREARRQAKIERAEARAKEREERISAKDRRKAESRIKGIKEKRESKRKSRAFRIWPILLIILLLGLLAAGAWFAYQNRDKIVDRYKQFFAKPGETPETSFDLKVNRTELKGFRNKVNIYNEEKVKVPLIFTSNIDKPILFEVETQEDWIEPEEDNFLLGPMETVTVMLEIDTEDVPEGDYPISFQAHIEGEDVAKLVKISVSQKSPKQRIFESPWTYILIGLIVFAVVVLIIHPIRKRRKSDIFKSNKSEATKKKKNKNNKSKTGISLTKK